MRLGSLRRLMLIRAAVQTNINSGSDNGSACPSCDVHSILLGPQSPLLGANYLELVGLAPETGLRCCKGYNPC